MGEMGEPILAAGALHDVGRAGRGKGDPKGPHNLCLQLAATARPSVPATLLRLHSDPRC